VVEIEAIHFAALLRVCSFSSESRCPGANQHLFDHHHHAFGRHGLGVTNLENGLELYYSPAAITYLYEEDTVVDWAIDAPSSGAGAAAHVETGVSAGHSYWVWTNHFVNPYYSDDPSGYCDEDGYSLLLTTFSDPGTSVFASGTVSYTSSPSIYLGSTYDVTNSYPPTISGIDQTSPGYGTAQADTSGWVAVYGNYLTTYWGGTTISIDGVSVSISWDSIYNPTQLNAIYSIPYSTSPGLHTLAITTPFGIATGPFTVYPPPAPIITGISPDTIMIPGPGMTTGPEVAITISGQYFGIICPTVNLPFAVDQDGAASGCSDTSATLTVYAEETAEISALLNPITVRTAGGTSNSFNFSVNGPFSMTVSSDATGENDSGPTRATTYHVLNLDGTQSDSYYDGELFSWGWSSPSCSGTLNFETSSCGVPQNNIIQFGTLHDTWNQLNPSSVSPASCGININDYWNVCTGLITHEIGNLQGNSYTTYTTIWGYVLSYPSDAGGMPADFPIPR